MKVYEHVLPERIFTHPIPVLQMRSPNAALLPQVVDIMLTRTRDCLGLFLACKRVRNEALESFLKRTTLSYLCPKVTSATATFSKTMPAYQRTLIRHLDITTDLNLRRRPLEK